MRESAIARHEAHLEEARRMCDSPDPVIAAQGRAVRDISLAMIRWHGAEQVAGTPAGILAATLNTVLAHALAGFAADHPATGNALAWHLEQIAVIAERLINNHRAEAGERA
jgi:hypothetical protein